MLAPLLAVALIGSFTWQGAMLVTGGLSIHVVLAGMLFRPLPEPERNGKAAMKKETALSSAVIKKLVLYCSAMLFSTAGASSVSMFLVKYGLELGLPIDTVAQLSVIRAASATLAGFGVAIISGSSCFNRRIAYASGVSLGGATALLFFFAPSRALYPVLLCVNGLGTGVAYSLLASVNVDLFGVKNLLKIQGIISFAAGCANFIGPLIAGLLASCGIPGPCGTYGAEDFTAFLRESTCRAVRVYVCVVWKSSKS
ncbi:PREDICTED: monocarboxylate transporter 12-like [Priapulus caudatus]|uniref:Monocarboxylate transporter 12-like n=1 Tax=Priapulus caudatus TaxID=37621 RepID=A0ABM1DV23_PRICU|nr:PREDICTED: monocarboxylate transporter 12-like [Priapulus caudatus]